MISLPVENTIETQWNLMKINDIWWKSMILGQFWGHFWAKVHKIINQWNERCTVVVWVLYATWIISECSGPSNMVIPSSWHLISCRTAQIPLGARHPTWVVGNGRLFERGCSQTILSHKTPLFRIWSDFLNMLCFLLIKYEIPPASVVRLGWHAKHN